MGHIHEHYDFTASAYIVHGKKVLLLHHKKIGKWLQPGGHIELDEDPEQTLWREIEEETGLKRNDLELIGQPQRPATSKETKLLPLPFDFNVHWFDDAHRHIDLGYMMRAKTAKLRLEADKAHDIGWFDKAGLDQLRSAGDMFEHTYNYSLFTIAQLHS